LLKKILICILIYISLTCNSCALINISIKLLNTLLLDNKIYKLISIQKQLILKIKNNYNIVNKIRDIKLFNNYKYTKS